jgi:hypothetical protein
MQKETIKIELTYAQIQMLLGSLYESQKAGLIDSSDAKLFNQTQTIIETAENDYFLTQVDNHISNLE